MVCGGGGARFIAEVNLSNCVKSLRVSNFEHESFPNLQGYDASLVGPEFNCKANTPLPQNVPFLKNCLKMSLSIFYSVKYKKNVTPIFKMSFGT